MSFKNKEEAISFIIESVLDRKELTKEEVASSEAVGVNSDLVRVYVEAICGTDTK